MRIGELAKAAGLTTKTLRYYEQLGIVAPTGREVNGYRSYEEQALERLRFVKAAQGAGLTLAEVGEILDLKAEGQSSCSHTTALLERHLAEIDAQLSRLMAARTELAALASRAAQLDPSACTNPDRCQVIALDLDPKGKVYGGREAPAGGARREHAMSDAIIDITVTGMTCEGCASKVRTALTQTPGVAGADIDVATGAVRVHLDGTVPADDAAFAVDEAVFAAGYATA